MRALLTIGITLVVAVAAIAAPPSDDQVRQAIIDQSTSAYFATGHNCPCPDNLASNGSRCGGRSAFSRRGGASPICYPEQITPYMILQWRRGHPG